VGKQLSAAALVVGGLPEAKQLSAIRAGARLVVATPGRLEDYIGRKLINFRALRVLVLDEADRMLDMGFLPAIRRIAGVLPKQRQTMCFFRNAGSIGRPSRKRLHENSGASRIRVGAEAFRECTRSGI